MTGQESVNTNCNTACSVWTSENTFLLWGELSTGTGCPKRFWSLHPWRYSKANWTWSWAPCSRWSCLSRGLDCMTRGAFQPQEFCDSMTYPSVGLRMTTLSKCFWVTVAVLMVIDPNYTKQKKKSDKCKIVHQGNKDLCWFLLSVTHNRVM